MDECFLELWIWNTHTSSHNIHDRFSLVTRFFFFPSRLLTSGGRTYLKRAVGREHILSVQNEISLIFLCPFSLSPTTPSSSSSQISLFLSHSVFFFFCLFQSPLIHIHYFTPSFLLSLLSVWGKGNSPSTALWANKMTLWFLITSALSYSSSIILLVSTS